MFGAGGHIADMIARFNQNRKMMLVRRERYEDLKQSVLNAKKRRGLHFPEGSLEARQKIRKMIIQQKRLDVLRTIGSMLIATILTITALYFLIIWIT